MVKKHLEKRWNNYAYEKGQYLLHKKVTTEYKFVGCRRKQLHTGDTEYPMCADSSMKRTFLQ